MELQNLHELGIRLQNNFRSQFTPDDIELPEGFKNAITEYGGYHFSYKKYMVHLTSDKLEGYIPNAWFYIASFFVEYYDELQKYRDLLINVLKDVGVKSTEDRDKWLSKYTKLFDEKWKLIPKKERNSEQESKCLEEVTKEIAEQFDTLVSDSPISIENKSLLKSFISDYRWWFGGKTIDRGDFYVSPILTLANVINDTHTYISGLCKFLSQNKEAAALLRHPNAIIIQNTLAAFFIDVFTYLYKNENKIEKIFSHLVPGSTGSSRYAYNFEGLKQTNFFVKGEENFNNARKGDFYEHPFVYKDEKYYLSLELAKSRKGTSNEISFDGFKPILESQYPNYSIIEENGLYILIRKTMESKENDFAKQIIYYGAPGTGKSYSIEQACIKYTNFRTTFHPDSDYSTFVGAYKPVRDIVEKIDATGHFVKYQEGPKKGDVITEERITYKFVPQAFMQAYIEAWKRYSDDSIGEEEKKVFLIIEEINRGNCAQIFGDLFQLLDRNDEGFSNYEIIADNDIRDYIANQNIVIKDLMDNDDNDISQQTSKGELLSFPPNLYIWATMNTSDQSLFPIDSAFKRRWSMKYVPIDPYKENWAIEVDDRKYSWSSFLEKVNYEIGETTMSEDKKLGFYFCKADKKAKDTDKNSTIISLENFASKVLFYIYNDVFKDYGLEREFFKDKENDQKIISFESLFDYQGEIKDSVVAKILDNLEVANFESDEEPEPAKSIKVTFADGTIIQESKEVDTYVNTIIRIGCDKVDTLGILFHGNPIVSKTVYPTIVSRFDDKTGYYVLSSPHHKSRIDLLTQISDRLGLSLNIEE